MKKYINYLFILSVVLFTSCVSLKPAKDINRAENKIIKYNKGIENQVERFPSLSDSRTIIEKDSLFIDSDSANFSINLIDTLVTSEIKEDIKANSEILVEVDSVITKIIERKVYDKESLLIVQRELNKYKDRADSLFNKYIEATELNNQKGQYQDSLFIVDWQIEKGKITIKPKTQPKYAVYEKSITTNNIDIRKDFWQDKKFIFLFLPTLLLILFFAGSIIQKSLQQIVKTVIKFARKIFTGGI